MQCVSLVDIDKTYPFSNSQANCKARLEILAGEIHAVVGENGAGKTTLMKILSGMYAPDGGSILIDGKPVSFASPADACALGIGMVHQHFAIIPGITAAENIVFGSEPRKGGIFIHPRRSLEEAKKTVERFGFSLDPDKPADLLTVGERQQVEILRQLHKDCRLLILDEPTSVLTEHEIRAFFSTLQELKTKGRTIVVISHKVREVMEISDSVTVMRDGRTLGEFKTAEMDEKRLSDLMMGSEEPLSFPEDHRHSRHEEAPRGPDVLGRDVLSFHRCLAFRDGCALQDHFFLKFADQKLPAEIARGIPLGQIEILLDFAQAEFIGLQLLDPFEVFNVLLWVAPVKAFDPVVGFEKAQFLIVTNCAGGEPEH